MKRSREPSFVRVDGEKMPRLPNRRDPDQVHRVWNKAYNEAVDYYTRTHAPTPKMIAANSAWRAANFYLANPGVAGWTRRGDRRHLGEGPFDFDPQTTIYQGKALEITYYGPNGLDVLRFSEPGLPDLYWNDDQKKLFIFPNMEVSTYCDPYLEGKDLKKAAKVYRTWHQRAAECHQVARHPEVPVYVVGSGDTVVYRSDKWGPRNKHPELRGSKEYLHQFDEGVFVATDPDIEAVIVEGNKLDVHPGGIVH